MTETRSDAVREALAEIMDVLAIADKGWGDGDVCVLQQAVDGAVFDRARAALQSAPAGETLLKNALYNKDEHSQQNLNTPSPVTPGGEVEDVIRRLRKFCERVGADYDSTVEDVMEDAARLLARLSQSPREEWRAISTAPLGDDDFYLVCCDDPRDDRSPFVVRGSIFASARRHPASHHLSMAYLTHWQPLPCKPSPPDKPAA